MEKVIDLLALSRREEFDEFWNNEFLSQLNAVFTIDRHHTEQKFALFDILYIMSGGRQEEFDLV